jgi:serine/threonine protein kinase
MLLNEPQRLHMLTPDGQEPKKKLELEKRSIGPSQDEISKPLPASITRPGSNKSPPPKIQGMENAPPRSASHQAFHELKLAADRSRSTSPRLFQDGPRSRPTKRAARLLPRSKSHETALHSDNISQDDKVDIYAHDDDNTNKKSTSKLSSNNIVRPMKPAATNTVARYPQKQQAKAKVSSVTSYSPQQAKASRHRHRRFTEIQEGIAREDAETAYSRSMTTNVNAPFRSAPGAFRVEGICSSSDDDNDEDYYTSDDKQDNYTTSDNETDENADDTAAQFEQQQQQYLFSATEDPIQATLVANETDIWEEQLEREREWAEREATMKQRELELERKMKQMMMQSVVVSGPVVVEAQAVTAPVVIAEEEEKRGGRFFRNFSRKRNGSNDNAKAPPPTLTFPTVHTLVAKQLGTTTTSSSSSALARSSDEDAGSNQLVRMTANNKSIPILALHELSLGKIIGSSTFNNVVVVLKVSSMNKQQQQGGDDGGNSKNTEEQDKQTALRDALSERIQQTKKYKYVIKRLQSNSTNGEPRKIQYAALQLQAEACLLSNLNHANIVQVHAMARGADAQDSAMGDFFYLMEQLDPNTLHDRIGKSWKRKIRGPQFFMERVQVATNLAAALDHLHSLNIMYCDLKPENVGFGGNGTLKLFNFGGAKILRRSTRPYDKSTVTAKPFAGTHPYVAPEVALKRPCGLGIDAYAFGILLWEIMTMKEPFGDLMIHEYSEQVIKGKARPKLDKKTPAVLNEIMVHCWHHDPASRPCISQVHLKLIEFQQQVILSSETKNGGYRWRSLAARHGGFYNSTCPAFSIRD